MTRRRAFDLRRHGLLPARSEAAQMPRICPKLSLARTGRCKTLIPTTLDKGTTMTIFPLPPALRGGRSMFATWPFARISHTGPYGLRDGVTA